MKLLFDMTLRRPGCVLLAAAYGADPTASKAFPSESWLVAPTDDMQVYEIDNKTLARAVSQVVKETR